MNCQLYPNDLKYSKYRKLDPKLNHENKDTLDYRFNECLKTGGLSLDISHLELTKLPPNIPKTVKFLFCSDNNFSVLEDLTFLFSLEVVDCGFNNLKKLPMFPKSIVEISCRNNSLEDASAIKTNNCPKLKRVDLSHNNLENIPGNSSIEQLIITNNKLKQLPILQNLNKLICNHNYIQELVNFNKLAYLECHHNMLTSIKNLPKLEYINCENNMIKQFEKLDSIKTIHCRSNPVKELHYFMTLESILCDYSDIYISPSYKIDKDNTVGYEKNNLIHVQFVNI